MRTKVLVMATDRLLRAWNIHREWYHSYAFLMSTETMIRVVAGNETATHDQWGMPERGFEPPPSCLDKNLNLARLPIPPLGRVTRFRTKS